MSLLKEIKLDKDTASKLVFTVTVEVDERLAEVERKLERQIAIAEDYKEQYTDLLYCFLEVKGKIKVIETLINSNLKLRKKDLRRLLEV